MRTPPMPLIHLHSELRNGMVPRVSLRTLILMVELLVAVIAIQYLTPAKPIRPDAVWLAADVAASPSAPACQLDDPCGT